MKDKKVFCFGMTIDHHFISVHLSTIVKAEFSDRVIFSVFSKIGRFGAESVEGNSR